MRYIKGQMLVQIYDILKYHPEANIPIPPEVNGISPISMLEEIIPEPIETITITRQDFNCILRGIRSNKLQVL